LDWVTSLSVPQIRSLMLHAGAFEVLPFREAHQGRRTPLVIPKVRDGDSSGAGFCSWNTPAFCSPTNLVGVAAAARSDERDVVEIIAPSFAPRGRSCVNNPQLAEERARQREDRRQATEAVRGHGFYVINSQALPADKVDKVVGIYQEHRSRRAVREALDFARLGSTVRPGRNKIG
jgi:hypothetical protein